MSKVLHIQGRQLISDDIELIRRLIAENPAWHRTRLSKEICQLWDWRTSKGLLKDMACRTMLRKPEEQDLIVLPKARTSGNRARKIIGNHREIISFFLCLDPNDWSRLSSRLYISDPGLSLRIRKEQI